MGIIELAIDGIEKLIQRLENLPNQHDDQVRKILYQNGLEMFAESQTQVPVEWGHLRSSGVVEKNAGGDPEVIIGYGNSAVTYAAIVHEMPDSTNWSTPGTKGKYLEDPVNAGLPKLKRELDQHVKAKIEGLR
jgi:hypothetical protein